MAESPTYFQNKANNRLVKAGSVELRCRHASDFLQTAPHLYPVIGGFTVSQRKAAVRAALSACRTMMSSASDNLWLRCCDASKAIKNSGLLTVQLSTRYDFERGPGALEKAVSDLCYEASNAIRNGAELIILSDVPLDFMAFEVSAPDSELEKSVLAIPPLLAVGAVHHYLIQQGLRTQASLVVSTGQCWSTHHFACLIGYGASAVCPYLALAHIRRWHSTDKGAAKSDGQNVGEVQANYKRAINAGLKKIMSKMGISVLESYRGAQIFQCIGLDQKVVDRAFTGTPCTAPALSFTDIANESMMFHRRAFPELEEKTAAQKLEFAGWYKYLGLSPT